MAIRVKRPQREPDTSGRCLAVLGEDAESAKLSRRRTIWPEVRRGVVKIAPVLVGVVPFGLVLGAQAAQKGLTVVGVALMCGLNFAGGSEFVAIELWRNPPVLFLIVGMTLLVNSRHLLMGATLAPHIRNLSTRKALVALFFMADETWAFGLEDARRHDAGKRKGSLSLPFYAGLAAGLYGTWILSTTAGAILGPKIGSPEVLGFDMAFPAVFLVIIRGLWKGARAAIPWVVSLVVAAAIHLAVPNSWYVPGGTLAGLTAAYLLSGQKKC